MNKQKLILLLSIIMIGPINWINSMEISSEEEEDPYERAEKYREEGEEDEALRLLEKAAAQGDERACIELAKHHIEIKNYKKAKELLKKLWQNNNSIAWRLRGKMCEEENNIENAKKCYERAALLGNITAETRLGLLWKNEGNLERALYHFKCAARAEENVIARYNVGAIYEIKQEYDRAERYYKEAASKGDRPAIDALKRIDQYKKRHKYSILGNSYRSKKNNIQAIRCFKRAAFLGDVDSLYQLWCIYTEEGRVEEATRCYHYIEKMVPAESLARYNFSNTNS